MSGIDFSRGELCNWRWIMKLGVNYESVNWFIPRIRRTWHRRQKAQVALKHWTNYIFCCVIHHQFIISSSSHDHQLIISTSSAHHQFIISSLFPNCLPGPPNGLVGFPKRLVRPLNGLVGSPGDPVFLLGSDAQKKFILMALILWKTRRMWVCDIGHSIYMTISQYDWSNQLCNVVLFIKSLFSNYSMWSVMAKVVPNITVIYLHIYES